MTSMLCHKQPGGSVKIYDTDVAGELSVDKDDNITFMSAAQMRERIAAEEVKLQQLTDEIRADLNKLLPVLDEEAEALDRLTLSQLIEMRALTVPPPLVVKVMEAVMILLGKEPAWEEVKKELSDSKFIQSLKEFDKENIPDAVLQKISQVVSQEDFTPENVKKVSKMAEYLCIWVRSIEKFGRVYREILSKKQTLKTMHVQLKRRQDTLNQQKSRSSLRLKAGRRPQTSPSQTRNMDSQSLIGQTMKVQDWLNEKTVKGVQEKSDMESKAARKLYSPLVHTEETFVKDVEDLIGQSDVMAVRKKEVLHKKWNERVYKPLRKKIIEVMDSNNWPDVDRRKREMHKQYLEFVNHKGHVFLDTMDPEEYYAMALTGHRPAPIKKKQTPPPRKNSDLVKMKPVVIRHNNKRVGSREQVETRHLLDPLLAQGRERNEEDRTILRCITGEKYTDQDIEQVRLPPLPLIPLGRHGTDSLKWLGMPLSNIESTPRIASRKRMMGVFNDTRVDFEEWSKTPYNHGEVDKELKIQKKRQFAEVPPFGIPPREIPRRVGFRDLDSIDERVAIQPLSPQKVSIGVGTD